MHAGAAAMRAWEADGVMAVVPREKGGVFGFRGVAVGMDVRMMVVLGGGDGGAAGGEARVQMVVVQALANEDKVCDAEVYGERDNGWDEIGPNGA
jgi:hypothetical protein